MMQRKDQVIGIIGAGKLGVTLGNLALNAGYIVYISSSKPVADIKLTVETLVPGATASTNSEIASVADIVILALPLSKYVELEPAMFANKIMIDAMNYWWEVDGVTNIYSDAKESSSEKVARYFADSKVIKAFNHISYHNLADYANQQTSENQIAVLFATDEAETIKIIEQIIRDFGFTPQYIGPLRNGRILETGEPLFGASMSRAEIEPLVEASLRKYE